MSVTPSLLIDKRKLFKLPHFRTPGVSGLITGVAAGTSSAGHLFSFRNGGTKNVVVTRLRLFWATLTGFTAAQELGFELFKVTGYSVDATGGTPITPQKRRTSSVASVAAARIATTGALTAGTISAFAAQPGLRRSVLELADGASVVKRSFEVDWIPRDDHGEVLAANEGLIVRNAILMGAGGVGRLMVEVDHFER
jgi:hypothetical protein